MRRVRVRHAQTTAARGRRHGAATGIQYTDAAMTR